MQGSNLDLTPIWISLKTASITIVITFILGLLAAWWIYSRKNEVLKMVFDGIFTLPMVLPPTVAGFFLLMIFGVNQPVGRFLMNVFGIRIAFSFSATVIAAVVISFPLMYRNSRGAFEQVDTDLVYVARTLGMNEWNIFLKVLIPNALPGIISGGVLAFARGLGEFGATAMLAGDALAGCGLEVIANDDSLPDSLKIKAVQAAARAMGPKGMIYGQELDLEYEDKPADKETLTKIHRHKTGKMISLCGELGSLGCELTAGQKDALTLFFDNIGIVFQIIDDVLDVEGDAAQLGKPVGSDKENNKSTFVSLYGLEKSKEIAREMTARADSRLKAAFGEKADLLIEYTKYLLSRNK